MNIQYHIRRRKSNLCVRMRREIIHQLDAPFHGVLGRFCLGHCDRAQCHEYGHIDGACIVQNAADNLLHAMFFLIRAPKGVRAYP